MPDVNVSSAEAALAIAPAPPQARVLLRGDPAIVGPAFGVALPTTPCTSVPGIRSALWLGPDEWLVLAPEGTLWPEWESQAGAAFDVGHRQLGLQVSGALAAATLATGCPLDLDEVACPVGTSTRTILGKVEIVLWRREPTLFHLEVGRSLVGYTLALLRESVRQ